MSLNDGDIVGIETFVPMIIIFFGKHSLKLTENEWLENVLFFSFGVRAIFTGENVSFRVGIHILCFSW